MQKTEIDLKIFWKNGERSSSSKKKIQSQSFHSISTEKKNRKQKLFQNKKMCLFPCDIFVFLQDLMFLKKNYF